MDMRASSITIGITTYNSEATILRCLRSCLPDLNNGTKILVVDDGSTDATKKIIASFARNDDRIICIEHSSNFGTAMARNTIISKCVTDFIAFLDSDDENAPQRIEHQLACLLAGEINYGSGKVIAFGGRLIVDGKTQRTRQGINTCTAPISTPNEVIDFLTMGIPPVCKNLGLFGSGTMFCRTSTISELGGFNTHLRRAEELDLCLKAARHGIYFTSPDALAIIQHLTEALGKSPELDCEWNLLACKEQQTFLCNRWPLAWIATVLYQRYKLQAKRGHRLRATALSIGLVLCWPPKQSLRIIGHKIHGFCKKDEIDKLRL